jgi:PAS domain S-box-containing protein
MANEAHNNAEPKELFNSSVWAHAENPAAAIAEAVAQALQCDEVHVAIEAISGAKKAVDHVKRAVFTSFRGNATPSMDDPLFSTTTAGLVYRGVPITSPLVVNDLTRARLPGDLSSVLATLGVRSFGVFQLKRGERVVGCISCFYKKVFHRWRSDEIAALEGLGASIPGAEISTADEAQTEGNQQANVDRYQRLATQGNIIILTTDRDFTVRDVFGNSEQLLGVSPDRLRGDPSIWTSLVDQRDAGRLLRRLMRLRTEQGELQEEVRVAHRVTGSIRWIHLRALPFHDPNGVLVGWEGFGVDVTDRREAEEALKRQNARLQAVFEVSRSLGELKDPAVVTLTGLRAILGATRSECGYAVFCDPDTSELEVVAAVGLSEEYLAGIDPVLEGPSLLRTAIDNQSRLLIPDLQKDPRAARALAELERIRAAIIVPLISENAVYGGLVLFKRTADSYDTDDFELAISAASQITLAIRQADLLEVQRRQSASLGSLYTVSRELAKYRSAVDFSDHVLPTLQSEFALTRCWIGLLNEQSTYLVGRAGFGPGVTQETIEAQIEISEAEAMLREVIEDRTPLVLTELAEEPPEAITGLFERPDSLVLVPMVAIGHVMGVLVIEPASRQTFSSSERLQLLVSMANEMATAILSGRFESKMANAVKMRTAGLLASGVAHNFNNILQAIMGQVSLVQLHARGNTPVVQAGHTIQEAAMRGASLVRQLLNFASQGSSAKVPIDVAALLNDSRALYESLLGKDVHLDVDDQTPGGTSIFADLSQLQQVITNMLANSRDAVVGESAAEVGISAHSVVVRAAELAADLAPGPYVRVDIRDNGVGMSEEEQARCFEPFFTTKNIDRDTGIGLSGSGLGLAAAYAIVKEHGGAITVHSKEGDGTVFSVYLPASGHMGRNGTHSTGRSVKRSRGVLLLGIEASAQPFLTSSFESLGYEARGVFDVRQAEDLLSREHNEWGAILIDGDGLLGSQAALCKELEDKFPEVAIICLQAASKLSGTSQQSTSEATDRVYYLQKPVTGWALEGAMQRINQSK